MQINNWSGFDSLPHKVLVFGLETAGAGITADELGIKRGVNMISEDKLYACFNDIATKKARGANKRKRELEDGIAVSRSEFSDWWNTCCELHSVLRRWEEHDHEQQQQDEDDEGEEEGEEQQQEEDVQTDPGEV